MRTEASLPERLTEISDRIGRPHEGTKPRLMYELYDRYFEKLAGLPIVLLELGVYTGESAKVYATFFSRGTVVCVDNENRGVDFSGFPNIFFEIGDQRDASQLDAICAAHAPDGLDIIIDDASHIGAWSRQS